MESLRNKAYLLLRRSERFFKTDMVYVARGAFWVNLPQVVSAILSLLVAVAFANFVTQETYGLYKYIISMGGIVGAFSLTGMNTAITRAVAQGKDRVFRDSIPPQIGWSLLTVFIGLAVSTYYFIHSNNILALGILIIALVQPISNVTNTYAALLNGKKNFEKLSWYSINSNIFSTVAIILSILLRQHVIVIVAAYVVTTAISNSVCFFKAKQYAARQAEGDDDSLKYGKRLSILNGLSLISSQLDSIMIFHYLGARELSLYAFAVLVPDRIKSLFKFTSTLALPKLSEMNAQEIRYAVKSKTLTLLWISAAAMIIYILVAPYLYNLIFNQYVDSIIYSQIFALSFLAIPTYISTSALLSLGNSKKLYLFSSVSPLFHIAIVVCLVYFWGLWGAVIARISSSFFNFGLSFYLTSRR